MLYTSGPVSLKERLLYTLNKLLVKQVKSFYLLLDPDFYFPVLTSQHKVHQVHKSTRYFHQSHTAFPQFVSSPSNFCSDLNLYNLHQVSSNRSKSDPKLCPTLSFSVCLSLSFFLSLRAQDLQCGLYSVIIKHLNIYYGIN